ncbi:MAG: hypothetical protein K2L12_06425 [Clostridia bacterium]|nr:hypothetical protein [Clostridia bacterium]
MQYPKYIKSADGEIGSYAYLTLGDRPVYRFENGEYKFRPATADQLANGSDRLSELKEKESFSMQWKQLSSSVWEAVGKYGKFRIERSRGKFWSFYASEDTVHNLRPTDKLSEAKDKCERHSCWECAV